MIHKTHTQIFLEKTSNFCGEGFFYLTPADSSKKKFLCLFFLGLN